MSNFERQNGELTGKQAKALEALLADPRPSVAATAAGVGESTLRRWLNEEVFARAYREAREKLLEGMLTSLRSASVDAVSCLRDVINDKDSPTTARVSAARAIIEMALKAKAELETEERLKALEASINRMPARRRIG